MPLATNNRRYAEFSTALDPRILRVKQAAGQLTGSAVDMNPAGAAQQRTAANTAGVAGAAGAAGTAGTVGTGTGASSATGTTVSGQTSSSYGGNAARPSQWTQTTEKPAAFSYDGAKPQAFTYNAEKPGQYQAPEALNPYKSQYTQQLDALMAQLTGRGDFKYDLNGDMLYQNYKDQYMLSGRQAMMDTMGQAQAMTGGYGNSYAQQTGQQAYQQHLTQLNNQIPALYDRAYQRWQDQGNQLLQNYGLLRDAENQDYARYQDELSQWNADRSFGYGQYQDALTQWNNDRNFDYARYQDEMNQWNADRNFAYGQYQDALTQWNADRNFDYARYQDALTQWNNDRNFEYEASANDRNYYGQLVNTLLSEGKWPNAELLAKAGYTENDIASYLGPRPDPNAQPTAGDYSAPGYEQQPYVPETTEPTTTTPTGNSGKTKPKAPANDTKKTPANPSTIPTWFGNQALQTTANRQLEDQLRKHLYSQYSATQKKNGTT